MTSDWLPAAAAFTGTAAGGLATYLAIRRQSRGDVRSSSADVIFQASESIRHDLMARLESVQVELAGVKAELAAVNARLAAVLGRLEG